jgi:large subunit ribosomal protein L24
MHIRKGDTVVLAKAVTGANHVDGRALGKEAKGSVARVLRVDHKRERVIVEGVNYRYKHERRSYRNPRGERMPREMPIDASNVSLYCPKCDRGVRVKRQAVEKQDARGKRRREVVRVCKLCGEALGAQG